MLSNPLISTPMSPLSHSFISSSSYIISFDMYLLLLISQESSDLNYIPNPCYPKGYNVTLSASSIYDTQCTKIPNDYKPDQQLFFVGTGNSDMCLSMVKRIFDFQTCSSTQCSFNGVEQPPVTGEFMVTQRANKTCARREIKMKATYDLSLLFLPGICRILLY